MFPSADRNVAVLALQPLLFASLAECCAPAGALLPRGALLAALTGWACLQVRSACLG